MVAITIIAVVIVLMVLFVVSRYNRLAQQGNFGKTRQNNEKDSCQVTAFLLYQAYSLTNRRIREVVEQQTSMALKFDLAIRKYVGQKIRPLMYWILGENEFIPEVMSTSYVARSIFEDVSGSFPAYILKFSSDNPRILSIRPVPKSSR